jgi:hypothetical protein
MHEPSEAQRIESVIALLAREFIARGADPRDVRLAVSHEHARYQTARIRSYIPILVPRNARERLRDLIAAYGRAGLTRRGPQPDLARPSLRRLPAVS